MTPADRRQAQMDRLKAECDRRAEKKPKSEEIDFSFAATPDQDLSGISTADLLRDVKEISEDIMSIIKHQATQNGYLDMLGRYRRILANVRIELEQRESVPA